MATLITFDSGAQAEVREGRGEVCQKLSSLHQASKDEKRYRLPLLHTFTTPTGRPITVDLWKIERIEN